MENTERQAQLFSELRKVGAEREKLMQDAQLGRTQEDVMRLGMELDQRAQHLQEQIAKSNAELEWRGQNNQLYGQMMGMLGGLGGGGGGGGGSNQALPGNYISHRPIGESSYGYFGSGTYALRGNKSLGGGWSMVETPDMAANTGLTTAKTRAINGLTRALLPYNSGNGVVQGGIYNQMFGPGGIASGSSGGSRTSGQVTMPAFQYTPIPKRVEKESPYKNFV
jgi:hypothetical protein